MKGLEPLGGEVSRALGRLGAPGAIGEVVAVWPGAVGAAIAANAWPARIARDGTLHVATSSSAWAFELTHLAGTVRERLAEQLGEAAPTQLRFAPGRLPERGDESAGEPARPSRELPPEALAAGEEIAAAIEDPALRAAAARAAAASLAGSGPEPSGRAF